MKKLFIFFLFPLLVYSQDNDRVALVIGNSKYTHLESLDNPVRDAKLIANTLDSIGFIVMLDSNLENKTSFRNIKYNFSDLIDSLDPSVVLIYYAGHGMEIGGENYLLPINIEAPEDQEDRTKAYIQDESFSLNKMKDLFSEEEGKINIFILDACRVPLKGKRGLISFEVNQSAVNVPSGTFLAFSTSSGRLADDGP